MSNYPQGTLEYTGGIDGQAVSILGGWEVTLAHGLTPSCFTVSMPMRRQGDNPPNKNGDLILRYGQTKITLKNCTIDKISQDVGGALIWHAVIFDRRYKWRWGQISGFYNVRWRNSTDVREETKKKPSELAILCLKAMGETGYDISTLAAFDGTDWPETGWNVASPAEALQTLCERYELRAVFDWKKDCVVVVKVGEGEKLRTSLKWTQYSGAFDPPEKPGKLVLLCAPSSVQYDFPLQAVALDVDGKVKLPDQVDYAPLGPFPTPAGATATPDFASGTEFDDSWLPWAGIDENFFYTGIPYLRQLAQRTMLRWYRIVPPEFMDGLWAIAGDNPRYLPQNAGSSSVAATFPLGDFGNLAKDPERSWIWQIALQADQNDRLLILADPQDTQFDEYNKEVSQTQLPAWVYGQYYDFGLGANVLQDDLDNAFPDGKPVANSGLLKLNPQSVFSPAQQGASTIWNQDAPIELQARVKETGFYDGAFAIDTQYGIVKFADPVYQDIAPKEAGIVFQFSDGKSLAPSLVSCHFPAALWLRTRFFVRDKDTREFIRYQKTRILDETSDTVRYVVRDDLTFKMTYRFKNPPKLSTFAPVPIMTTDGSETNQVEIDKAAEAYLDQIAEEYETRRPETIVHPMLVDYTLDGAVRQVTWMTDSEGHCFTRASRDCEELHIIRDYGDRRLAERQKAIANGTAPVRGYERELLESGPRPNSTGQSLNDFSATA